MRLQIQDLSCGYGSKIVIKRFNTVINSGEILCLLGPNGVGKTTLFKTILGHLKPQSGSVLLNNQDIHALPKKEFARIIGYVPQAHTPPFPFRVIDVVMMGRTAHMGTFGSPGVRDKEIAEAALERLNVTFLRNRIYTEISGGERQMVLLARALAQEPKFLLMDEPTSSLDFGNQVRVLQCVSSLARENKIGIIMTTHFPDHVFQCKGRVALLKHNNRFLEGSPDKIITAQNMKDAYGVDVQIIHDGSKDMSMSSCVPITRME